MARTPKTTTEAAAEPALNETALAVVGAAPAQLTAAQEAMTEMLDLGRRLGQMETAAFVGNISDGILLSSFENVKKSKAWKLLRNKSGEIFPSLDAFCTERLGFSARRLSQIQGNRDMLGQDTFTQAEQLGLRQIDYNAIKALPAPDQELVRRAVEEAQSREEVIDLLQELAVRHAQVNEAAAEEKKQLQQDHEYASEQLEKERNRADQAEKKLRAGGLKARPLDEQVAPFQEEISARQGLMEKGIAAHIEAVLGVEAWWTKMVTDAPDYDPTRQVPMPREVALVALQLEDAATRMAQLVGAMQHELQTRFGDDLAEARQYLMQEPEGENA